MVLIESDWNLKHILHPVLWAPVVSINRIRLEFKAFCGNTLHKGVRVLIESDWNLKQRKQKYIDKVHVVLIESDWNLKLKTAEFDVSASFVLIESDWNLKQINEEWANRHMSINRIRLEFKEHHRCTEAVTQFLY